LEAAKAAKLPATLDFFIRKSPFVNLLVNTEEKCNFKRYLSFKFDSIHIKSMGVYHTAGINRDSAICKKRNSLAFLSSFRYVMQRTLNVECG